MLDEKSCRAVVSRWVTAPTSLRRPTDSTEAHQSYVGQVGAFFDVAERVS